MRNIVTAMVAIGVLLTSSSGCGSSEAAGQSSVAPSATASTSTSTSPSAPATPVVEKRKVTETRAIPFKTKRMRDPTLSKGRTRVRTRGVKGVTILTYEVTLTNGVQTGRRLIRNTVAKAPVTRILGVGTKRASQCDPNYSGACVPIASDVDCSGGSGNGPAYVQGPVRVVGSDIYDLDRDGDGIACDT